METQTLITTNLIVKVLVGSHAYGTATKDSDTDYRGIFYAPPRSILTPFFKVGEIEAIQEEDTKFYELSKFIKLLVDQNPNIVELLWVPTSCLVTTTEAYAALRAARSKLLSSKIRYTMAGYAFAQLKRIKGHKQHLTNPQPTTPPKQGDFVTMHLVSAKDEAANFLDFQEGYALVPYDQNLFGLFSAKGYRSFDDATALIRTETLDTTGVAPKALVCFNQTAYRNAKALHQKYWHWKNGRNPIRAAMEEAYGYDCKHAMHLIRLLRMALETLETGQVFVQRADWRELLDIRSGELSYEDLLGLAERLMSKIEDAYARTKLQKTVDLDFAASLVQELYLDLWAGQLDP